MKTNLFLSGIFFLLVSAITVFGQKTVFLAPQPHKLLYADTVYQQAVTIHDTLMLAEAYYLYGKTYEATGDYMTSKQWFMKSLRILAPRGDSPQLSRLYTWLSHLAFVEGNYFDMLNYTRLAIAIARRVNAYQYLARAYGNMAGIHETDWSLAGKRPNLPGKRLDSVLYYLQKVKLIAQQNKDSTLLIENNLRLGDYLSRVYRDSSTYLLNYRQAVDYLIRKKEDGQVVRTMLTLANVYIQNGQSQNAFETIKKAKRIYDRHPFNDIASKYHFAQTFSKYYQMTGNWKLAYEYNEKSHEIQIAGYTSNREGAMSRLSKEYESERKDLLLRSKDTELTLRTAALKAQQRFTITALVFLSLTVLMSVVFYKLYKKNQGISRQNELLVREQNHRVKNNLQAVSSLLSLQSDTLTDPGAIKAIEESRLRVETMTILHRKLYDREQPVKVYLSDFLEELTENVLATYGYHDVNLNMDINATYLSADKAVHLGLILNELITNCCKYAFPGNADPNLSVKCGTYFEGNNHFIKMRVADNGVRNSNLDSKCLDKKGIKKNESGFGLRLIKMESEQLYGRYTYEYVCGTIFRLDFPIEKTELA